MKYRIKTTYSVQEKNKDGTWVTIVDRFGDRTVFEKRAEAVKFLAEQKSFRTTSRR